MKQNFYDFEAEDINGNLLKMSEYEGKTILIVNTATKCGLAPQFNGLEELYQEFKDQGLVVLGFPCNQFLNQEPGVETQIAKICQKNYNITFPLFSKIKVNGSDAHPIYKYLKSELSGLLNDSIKWNFTKFLVNKNGKPLKRFAPFTTPGKIKEYIQNQLSQES